jgi:hypothetical protein
MLPPTSCTSEAASAVNPTPGPTPRTVQLPLGGSGSFFTREQLTQAYRCNHAELGRLLRDKIAPLPIRIDGTIYWFADEVAASTPHVTKVLERRRK